MNDMRAVIIPKSDQINADDLIAGPLTVTITAVAIRPGTEQPVTVNFDGDGGKPYKPCKVMCRVMVVCWGPDANQYVGKSMTLYRDAGVKWGGLAVGGIRISHMTDIKSAQTMALTETKGSKKPFTVKPLVMQADAAAAEQAALLSDARKAADLGVAAYQAFWKGLNKGRQAFLLPEHDGLKAAAKAADERAAQATDEADGDSVPFDAPTTAATDEDAFPGDRP